MGDISRPVLDPSRLDALREVDSGLPAEVADVWLKTTPAVVERLRSAALAGDAVELASTAHALRGSSANVGADLLADACALVEAAGRSGSDVGAAVELVAAEHARAATQLAAIAAAG